MYALENTDALSEETLIQLRGTAADSVLQAVCEKHMTGWPMKKRSLDRKLHSYWPMRQNINIQNDIVMVGDKIVIPQSFRRKILEKLHLAHQGVQRTKAKARKSPLLARHGERYIDNGGEVCAVPAAIAQTRQSHLSHIRSQTCHG